jgi:site-specific recombinase XerD
VQEDSVVRTAPLTATRLQISHQPADDFDLLARSFERSLKAENKAVATIRVYKEGVRQLRAYLTQQGMPCTVAAISREHIECWLVELGKRVRPATVALRFKAGKVWFGWLVLEGELERSPMQNMRSPQVVTEPPPIPSEDTLRKLLKGCEGTSFIDRRDMALLRLTIDTGARRAEIMHLKVGDVDFDNNVVHVLV